MQKLFSETIMDKILFFTITDIILTLGERLDTKLQFHAVLRFHEISKYFKILSVNSFDHLGGNSMIPFFYL